MRTDFENGWFARGDCFDWMRTLPDQSVDMVLCDLPYGTTACKWDSVLPLETLWSEYWRVCCPAGAVVLTASQPFSTVLGYSALNDIKYSMVWEKNRTGGFFDVKHRPLKSHEDILVFSKGGAATGSRIPMTYNPQGTVEIPPKRRGNKGLSGNVRTEVAGKGEQTTSNYPRTVLRFSSEGKTIHPTQKPVALFEYLIRTYTNPGDTVLDNTAGSGTTAIAAENAGRKWICIERDEVYYEKAIHRVREHLKQQSLFGEPT